MASKPKTKDFIVHHRGKTKDRGCCIFGRYRVGARNSEEAEKVLRDNIGKHCNVKTYYECKEIVMKHGEAKIDDFKNK